MRQREGGSSEGGSEGGSEGEKRFLQETIIRERERQIPIIHSVGVTGRCLQMGRNYTLTEGGGELECVGDI